MVTTNTDLDPQYVERTAPQVILNKMTKSKFDSTEKDPDQLYAITDINVSVEQELTQAQYNALSDSEKNNGTTYYITDGNPSGSVESYSLTEVLTGGTWIDGKPIYKKTVHFGALPNNTSKSVSHEISNMDKCIKYDGIAYLGTNQSWWTLPLVMRGTETAFQTVCYITNSVIYMANQADRSPFDAYVTIWYTKN